MVSYVMIKPEKQIVTKPIEAKQDDFASNNNSINLKQAENITIKSESKKKNLSI